MILSLEEIVNLISKMESVPDYLIFECKQLSQFFYIEMNFERIMNEELQMMFNIRLEEIILRYKIQLTRIYFYIFKSFPMVLFSIGFEQIFRYPDLLPNYFQLLARVELTMLFNLDHAENYYQVSTICARAINDKTRIMQNKANQAMIYKMRDEDWDSCFYHLFKAVEYFKYNRLFYDELKVRQALALVFLELGDTFSAKREMSKYLELADRLQISHDFVSRVCRMFTEAMVTSEIDEDESNHLLHKSIVMHAKANSISYYEALRAIMVFDPNSDY